MGSLDAQKLQVASLCLSMAQQLWHAIVTWDEIAVMLHMTPLDQPQVPDPAEVREVI